MRWEKNDKKFPVELCIYFDFKSLMIPTNEKRICNCHFTCKCDSMSYSIDLDEHRYVKKENTKETKVF